MKYLVSLFAILTITNLSFAQNTGQILNQKTNEPIPYVNIQVLGKQKGFTSNLNGQFKITSQAEDSLVFSAIGFKNKTLITGAITNKVFLEPTSYKIPEVTISNEEERTVTIGRVKKQIISNAYMCSYGGEMIARFFPYINSYQHTKFIKSIEFLTESKVENAKFNIRLYKADSLGYPSTPIHNKNLITTAEKGYKKTKVDLINLYIQFPKEGLFVIVEWLDLEENKSVLSYKVDGREKSILLFQPDFFVESHKEEGWSYYGDWKQRKNDFDKPIQVKIILRN